MAKNFKSPLPGALLFFIGVAAIVTSLLAILFIFSGLFLFTGSGSASANYILVTGLIMVPVSTLFTTGLFQLKSQKKLGAKLVSIASILIVLILGYSAFTTIIIATGWKLGLLIFIISVLIVTPFIWLTFYLWKFSNKKALST